MQDRRCPYCGELVTSTSVTCPKCYKKIPFEPQERPKDGAGPENGMDDSGRRFNRKIGLILNLIPGLFGILGLGQIYRDHRSASGYVFLVLGLLLFGASTFLMLGLDLGSLGTFLSKVTAFPMMLLYALLYIGAAIDILLGFLLHLNVRY